MNSVELSYDLSSPIRERVSELLEKPYAGSKAFNFNHEDAKYRSNCHGTMVYVFGLDDPLIKEEAHPGITSYDNMEDLIDTYFTPLDSPKIGSLIAFYDVAGEKESLLHTALQIGENGKIFEQPGTGGQFKESSIESKVRTYTDYITKQVEVRCYDLKP